MGAASVAALVVAAAVACSSEPPFDRSGAVDNVVRDSGGQLTRPQAECYVDRVLGEVGSNALTSGTQPRPEYLSRLTRIRVDCTGVASLGTQAPTTATTLDANLGSRPMKPGDDPDLDTLFNACSATGASACDNLFDKSAPGSAYEEFASTCGGRTKETSCAARYGPGGPGAAPASPTTTLPAAPPTTTVRAATSTTRKPR